MLHPSGGRTGGKLKWVGCMSVRSASDFAPGQIAVIAILVTVGTLSLSDALAKLLSASFPLWQIFALRSMLTVPMILLILAIWYRTVSWRPRSPLWVSLRSLLMVAQAVVYYIALPKVELSAVAATNYTMPLFVCIFAAVLLGEKISPAVWAAVGLGFSGVLLIVQPATESFNGFALLPLAAAMLAALANLLTKAKCQGEHPLVISLNLNVALLMTGLVATLVGLLWDQGSEPSEMAAYLLGGWAPMGRSEWLVIVIMAVSFVVGSVGAALAYQIGPPTTIATLDFAYIAFALVWGMLFFAEFPNSAAFLGILTIIAAGTFVVRSQRVR